MRCAAARECPPVVSGVTTGAPLLPLEPAGGMPVQVPLVATSAPSQAAWHSFAKSRPSVEHTCAEMFTAFSSVRYAQRFGVSVEPARQEGVQQEVQCPMGMLMLGEQHDGQHTSACIFRGAGRNPKGASAADDKSIC